MCISTIVHSRVAAVKSISGSKEPDETSLIISAPAVMAAEATLARYVSTEMARELYWGLDRRALMVGSTLESSCWAEICGAKGRVDWPPMSRIEAPDFWKEETVERI